MAAARWLALAAVACCVAPAWSKACAGENLPADAPIRIGKKFVPEECTKKSKPGDKLTMNYVGKLCKPSLSPAKHRKKIRLLAICHIPKRTLARHASGARRLGLQRV